MVRALIRSLSPSAWALVALLAVLHGPSVARADKPTRYFVIIKSIQEAPAAKSGILDEARKILLEEVGKHPELSTERPPGLPDEPEALGAALRGRHLRAVEVVLNIAGVTRAVRPPAPGKRFQVLARGIHITITGTTLPDWLVAMTGDGDAEAAAEVGGSDNQEREGRLLLIDAGRSAISQALDQMVAKLKKARADGGPPKTKKKR